MRRIVAAFLCVLLSFMLFASCDTAYIRPVDDLMHPPTPFGSNKQLQEAFVAACGKDTILKAPIYGDHRSAFVLYDMDQDGKNEAIVMFVYKTDKAVLQLALFQEDQQGQWQLVDQRIGAGTEVYDVNFVQMAQGEAPKIVITWNLTESAATKKLTIYSYLTEQGTVKQLAEESITTMIPADIDQDGSQELVYILQETLEGLTQARARVLKLNPQTQTIGVVAETPMDPRVSGYMPLQTDQRADNGAVRIVADAYQGSNSMITEMLYWDKKASRLVNPLLDAQALTNTATQRPQLIGSVDINNDSILEIPLSQRMPGGITLREGDLSNTEFYLTQWTDFDLAGKGTAVCYCAMILPDQYYFLIPQEMKDRITITSDETEHRMRVFEYDPEKKERGRELFVVETILHEKYDEVQYGKEMHLFATDIGIVIAQITDAGKQLDINKEFLQKQIVALAAREQ